MVCVARSREMPPFAQGQLLVHCATTGLVVLESIERLAIRHLAITANGIMDNLPGRPFFIWVTNLRETPLHVPIHKAVGMISTDPLRISQIPRQDPHQTDSSVLLTGKTSASQEEDDLGLAACTVGPTEGKDPPHWPISDADTPLWNETQPPQEADVSQGRNTQVSIGNAHEAEWAKAIDFLTPFSGMWDGHLGNFKSVQQRIDLRPDSSPVHQQPYRAKPQNRAPEKKRWIKCWKWESSKRRRQNGSRPSYSFQSPTIRQDFV